MTGMAEYIEREALIKQFCERCNEEMSESPCEPSECFAREVIIGVPAVGVAPVRHGRWICIRKGYGEYECSVCHGVDSDCSDYYGTHVVTEQDYCPNCGSRMDGDDDE